MFKKVDHIAIAVRNLEESKKKTSRPFRGKIHCREGKFRRAI